MNNSGLIIEYLSHLRRITFVLLVTSTAISLVYLSKDNTASVYERDLSVLAALDNAIQRGQITEHALQVVEYLRKSVAESRGTCGYSYWTAKIDGIETRFESFTDAYSWLETTDKTWGLKREASDKWIYTRSAPTIGNLVKLWNELRDWEEAWMEHPQCTPTKIVFISSNGETEEFNLFKCKSAKEGSRKVSLIPKWVKKGGWCFEGEDERGKYRIDDVKIILQGFSPKIQLLRMLMPNETKYPEFGRFSVSFPSVARFVEGNEDMNITAFSSLVRHSLGGAEEKVQILGSLSVPVGALDIAGMFIVILIQLYLLIHFISFQRIWCKLEKTVDFPWIGIYRGWLPRLVFWGVIVAIPLVPSIMSMSRGFSGSFMIPVISIILSSAVGVFTAYLHWKTIPLKQQNES